MQLHKVPKVCGKIIGELKKKPNCFLLNLFKPFQILLYFQKPNIFLAFKKYIILQKAKLTHLLCG